MYREDMKNIVNNLYQGKLKGAFAPACALSLFSLTLFFADYVQCPHCGFESSRQDVFLDVPLGTFSLSSVVETFQ